MARKEGVVESAVRTPSRRSGRVSATAAPIARLKRKRAGPEPKYTDDNLDFDDDYSPVTSTSRKRKQRDSSEEDFSGSGTPPVQNEEEDSSELSDVPGSPEPKPTSKKPVPKKKAVKTPDAATTATPPSTSKSKSNKPAAEPDTGTTPSKPKRKRKTKEEKEAEAMPIAPRTPTPRVLIGAHISAAGGVHNAVTNSVHIGGNAFALFLKSQRKWDNPPIKPEANTQFHHFCHEHGYDKTKHIVPHGSYLVNLAAKDADKSAQAYAGFLDDILRAESLGITLYNFHPGNTNGEPRSEAIARIAAHLNAAHRASSSVITLLENMAASPTSNTIGSRFEDLRSIINLVDDKTRVGVCLDTCHAFAAGYDLRSPTAFADTMLTFGVVVGTSYIRAVHMNDSKAPLGAHRDLHQNIGTGFLGLRAFHNVVNYPLFAGLPLVLETPIDRKDENGKTVEDKSVWAKEIKLLESLIGMDAEGEEFRALESELADRGAEERRKYQEQFEKKVLKAEKSAASGRGKKKKKGQDEEDDQASQHGSEQSDDTE